MDEKQALTKLVPPGRRRPGKPNQGVLQIWITRRCDKACFNCTQGSNLKGAKEFISVDQFEEACLSVKDYFGLVGLIGGNPALHPQFEELCDIVRKHFPKEKVGLWCNKPFGHGKAMRETFSPRYSNLNVHCDKEAFDEFKRDWPEAHPFGLQDCRHPPVHLALMDVVEDEGERWQLISQCDLNAHWSAMICVFRGELRGYFCEVAAAQAMLHQHDPAWPDLGAKIEPGWWKGDSMEPYAEQARFHCHRCAVPLKGYGVLAQAAEGAEQTSETHADIYMPKKKDRPVQIVTSIDQVLPNKVVKVVDYMGNAKR